MLTRKTRARRLKNAQERLDALKQAIATHERRLETARNRLKAAEQEVDWLEASPVLDEPVDEYAAEEDLSEGPPIDR